MISWLGSVSNTETACPKWGLLPQPRPRAAGRPGRGPELGPTLRVKAVGARPLASHLLPARDSRRLSLDPSPSLVGSKCPSHSGWSSQPCRPCPWPERTRDLAGPVRSLPWHFLCRRWRVGRSLFSMDLSCQDVTKAVSGHILSHWEEPRRKWPQALRWGRPWLRPTQLAPSCHPPCGSQQRPIWSRTSLSLQIGRGLNLLGPCRGLCCPKPLDPP